MAANLQQSFDKLQKIKKEQKELRQAYRDSLLNNERYNKVLADIKVLREKKKEIEQGVRAEFSREMTKLDDLKIDWESENEVLSDIALNTLLKGEQVEVSDEYENKYEPIFSVKFKKAG